MVGFPKIVIAWLRSWRKPVGTWTLEDYPVVVRPNGVGFDLPPEIRVRAEILRWPTGPKGIGPDADAARAGLAQEFETRGTRPRPGTRVPIEFAASGGIASYGPWTYDVVEAITGIRPFFVSDDSSLSDFPVGEEEYVARTRELYGVDISDVENGHLITVLDRIAATGRGPSSP